MPQAESKPAGEAGLRALIAGFVARQLKHNGFTLLQRYYERHFTSVGKAMLLLGMISLSLGMVGTEVLIYIFLCSLAALWCGTLVLGWLSRPRRVNMSLSWPESLQAGQPARLGLRLQHAGRKPHFHLLSEILLRGPDQQRLLLHQQEELFCLSPGEQAVVPYDWTPPARGRWQVQEHQLISLFPLGLSLWRLRRPSQGDLWVYPRPLPFAAQPWNQHQPQLMQSASQATMLRGESLDFQGIRPWMSGDSPRFIHWPSLARTGHLTVREYQESQGHQIALLLPTDSSGSGEPEAFEAAVSLLAGLVHELSALPFHQLLLAQLGQHLALASQGALSVDALQLQLAAVRRDEACPLDALWQALQVLPVPPTLLICVTSRWDARLEQFLQQCQLRRWPLEIFAVGASPEAFPAGTQWIDTASLNVTAP